MHKFPLWYSPANRPSPDRSNLRVTIDEELSALDEHVRRLKIEYDIFFGGGSKKPPADIEWRVQNLLRKHTDRKQRNSAPHFRFHPLHKRYALSPALCPKQ